MTDHKDYIRQQIIDAAKNRTQSVPKNNDSPLVNLLMFCVFIIFLITMGGIVIKTMDVEDPKKSEIITKLLPLPDLSIEKPSTEKYLSRTEASQWMSSIDSKLESMNESLNKRNHRLWLLGIAHNENAVTAAALEKKYYGESANYITFDRNWKMSRMPTAMKFEGQEAEDIKDSIK